MDSTRKLTNSWTRINGLRMHARISKRGNSPAEPPVILVHGLGVSSLYMVPLAEHLAPYFDVYAPDLPGFGRSQKPRHALDMNELAGALADWMDAVGLSRAAFVGNSLGCQIVVEFAMRHPERITHAVLVGPTADPKARTMMQEIGRAVFDIPRERFSLLLICVYDYLRAGIFRFLRTLRFLVEDSLETKLPRLHAPTLVIRGESDPIVPADWAHEIVRLLPEGRYITIPGAAHAAHYTAPEAVAEATRRFIQTSASEASTVARSPAKPERG